MKIVADPLEGVLLRQKYLEENESQQLGKAKNKVTQAIRHNHYDTFYLAALHLVQLFLSQAGHRAGFDPFSA
jgi:hypothetical protein